MTTQTTGKRIDEIEGIRGVLSMIVVLGHINLTWMPWNWGCMEIFFAISGFLIGRIALRNRTAPNFWGTYLSRRVRRIWPLYFVVLAFCIADTLICRNLFGNEHAVVGLWAVKRALFLQNIDHYFALGPHIKSFWDANSPDMFVPAWSVAVEEQFYLVAPFAAVGIMALVNFMGLRVSRLALVIVGFLAVCITLRAVGFHWWILLGRMDGFALGLVLGVIKIKADEGVIDPAVVRTWVTRGFWVTSAVTLPLMASMYRPSHTALSAEDLPFAWTSVFGVSIFGIFGTLLVAACAFQCVPQVLVILRLRVLQFLGKVSYSTYLWHMPILFVMSRSEWFRTGIPGGFHVVALLGLMIGVSYLSYRYIELPWLRVAPKFDKPTVSGQTPVTTGWPIGMRAMRRRARETIA